jgi:hypothetical protein
MRIFFLISAICFMHIHGMYNANPKIIGPLLIETTNSFDVFNSGKVSMYGVIRLGVATTDTIYIKGLDIEYPLSEVPAYLGINAAGQVVTVHAPTVYISDLVAGTQADEYIALGLPQYNYIGFVSSSGDMVFHIKGVAAAGPGANSLSSLNAARSNLRINADGEVYIRSKSLFPSSYGEYQYVVMDQFGKLVGLSDGTLDGNFLNLTAAPSDTSSVSLGIPNGNAMYFISGEGSYFINGMNDINIQAVNGAVNVNSVSTNIIGQYVACGTQEGNNIIFNDLPGSQSATTINANELSLNTDQLKLGNQSLWPSDCSSSNYLMIDCNGYITICCSSKQYKTDIHYLDNPTRSYKSLDYINPCEFRYKGNALDSQKVKNLSVGYIAEDFDQYDDLKEFVIYDRNNQPMSLDYTSILVAKIYLLEQKLKQNEIDLMQLQESMKLLENQYKKILENNNQ